MSQVFKYKIMKEAKLTVFQIGYGVQLRCSSSHDYSTYVCFAADSTH